MQTPSCFWGSQISLGAFLSPFSLGFMYLRVCLRSESTRSTRHTPSSPSSTRLSTFTASMCTPPLPTPSPASTTVQPRVSNLDAISPTFEQSNKEQERVMLVVERIIRTSVSPPTCPPAPFLSVASSPTTSNTSIQTPKSYPPVQPPPNHSSATRALILRVPYQPMGTPQSRTRRQ